MVKAKHILVLIVAGLALVLAGAYVAAGETAAVTETYQITLNDVGDGHVVDTIKYPKDAYKEVKKVEKKNRGFLTRRFSDEDNKGELHAFKVEMKDDSNSVIITYDKPGMAYTTKGDFTLYAFSKEPKKVSEHKFTEEETSTVENEFTLFEPVVFKTTTEVILPAAAKDAHYDEGDQALVYKMPAPKAQYGLLSDRKALFSTVFGVLTLLFAGMLGFVVTRKPVEREAPEAGVARSEGPGPVEAAPRVEPPAASTTAAMPTGPIAEPPAPAVAEKPSEPEKAERGHKFCSACGHQLKPGNEFCTRCGKRS